MTKAQDRMLDQLAAIPDDPKDWEAGDLFLFQSIHQSATEDAARRGRRMDRKTSADAQRATQRRPVEGWTEADGYAAVDARSGGRCEHPNGCQFAAIVHHHKGGRRGPDPHNPSNLLHLCEKCHLDTHAHPSRSYSNGSMVKRLGQPSATMRLDRMRDL